MTAPDRVMIFDVDAGRAAKIAGPLEDSGLATAHGSRPAEAADLLRKERPALAVVVLAAGPFPGLLEAARAVGIPVLAVVEPDDDSAALAGKVRPYGSWVAQDAIDRELPVRAAGLIAGGANYRGPVIDPRFLALVVHDLRTPLNVIGLTIRAIEQSAPAPNPELEEDLVFLQENARQIERMLAQLGDYCRLLEAEQATSGLDFEPRRFLSDFVEDRRSRPGVEVTPVRLEFAAGTPAEVSLDPTRVRLALQHALANAIAAAGDAPVSIRSGGGAGRWIIELVVDKPPPAIVHSIRLRPGLFERLAGSAAERRGLDLAIAARVSELFGGSARLEVEPGTRSTILLDWPERLGQP